MFTGLRLPEIALIAFVAILFFGANKLPALSRNLRKSIKIIKSEISSTNNDVKDIKSSTMDSKTKL